MTDTYIYQVAAIAGLLLLTVICTFRLARMNLGGDKTGEGCWIIKAARIGAAQETLSHILMQGKNLKDCIELPAESFTLGNSLGDDIYVDSGGEKVRLYLNVHQEKIYLTVLKGSVSIYNQIIQSGRKECIELHDFSRVELEDIQLQFVRKRVRE